MVRRISLLAQKNAPLRLAFQPGELTISAQTPDIGEAHESMPVPFQGEPLEIGFNPEFLRAGLEAIEEGDVLLKLISPLRPGLIESADGSRLPVPDHADPPERLGERARAGPQPEPARLPRLPRRAGGSSATGLTVVTGPNGAGKTNLLEALYFGCTGRSCRTTNEREVVQLRRRRGADRRSCCGDEDGTHELSVGFVPGQPKRMRVDGAPVERLLDVPGRPLVSVFLPDRLELIKGAAGAAPRPPRPVRRGAVAGAGGDAPRLRAGARAAQRSDRPDPRAAAGPARRSRAGTRSWPRTGSR